MIRTIACAVTFGSARAYSFRPGGLSLHSLKVLRRRKKEKRVPGDARYLRVFTAFRRCSLKKNKLVPFLGPIHWTNGIRSGSCSSLLKRNPFFGRSYENWLVPLLVTIDFKTKNTGRHRRPRGGRSGEEFTFPYFSPEVLCRLFFFFKNTEKTT